MKKIFVMFLILLVVSVFIVLNLGKYLDISDNPVQSDVIVCLGGGDKDIRIKKALQLYEKSYSKRHVLLITGGTRFTEVDNMADDRIKYVSKHASNVNVEYNPRTKNTEEEILYIRSYMIEKKLKSVLVVSEALYSRRIKMLADIANFQDKNIKIYVVSSEPRWWNKEYYYKNIIARYGVFSEMLKIPYNYILYGILDKIGFLEQAQKIEKDMDLRKSFHRFIRGRLAKGGTR